MAIIRGKEHPLRDIFSDQFAFTIPSFQRPYSWREEHAKALISDLIAFMRTPKSTNDIVPYFLGSIVLIKKDGLPEAEVVDGQQRLTTLTIILSALRSLAPAKTKTDLTKFIYEEGNDISNTPDRFRLTLRERDIEFFQKYIQRDGNIEKLANIDIKLPESQQSIKANALLILQNIKKLSEEERTLLAKTIIQNCFLVEISTSDLESAYNVFSILNDRGLNLSHADILKAQIIGIIPSQQRERYTKKWEDIEEALGNNAFRELFSHLNTIFNDKNENPGSLLVSFRENVFPANKPNSSPTNFIDDIFLPYGKALAILEQANYKGTKDANKINYYLKCFQLLQSVRAFPFFTDWKTVILYFLALNSNNVSNTLHFLQRVERLLVVLMTNLYKIKDPEEVLGRPEKALHAIKHGYDLYGPGSPLYISKAEKDIFLETLNSNMYNQHLCKYTLLRLDHSLAAANEATYEYSITTIEHVLPQNPKKDSTWLEWFPQAKERNKYVHCLGNLVLLSRRKNSEVQNVDFAQKKQRYFASKKGVTSFVLTSQVAHEEVWTPEVIERRQKMIIEKLKEIWDLDD